jgi:hypothetical protein
MTDSEASEAEVAIVVLVDPDRFDATAQALSDAGVTLEQQSREIGIIGGHVRADRLTDVDQLDGVVAVEVERTFQLPPPDSPVQ